MTRANADIPGSMPSPPASAPRVEQQNWGKKALVSDALVNEELEAVANEAGRGDTHCDRAQSASRAAEATRTLSSPSLHAAPVHEALSNEPSDAFANEQGNADARESTETDAVTHCSRAQSASRATAATRTPSFPSSHAAPVHEALSNEPVDAFDNERPGG